MKDIYTRHQQQKTRHKYARGTRSEGFGIAVFNISTKMTNEGSVVVICVLKNIHWLCLLKEDKSMGNHAGTCSLREYLVSVQLYFETFTWTRERESELMTAKMMITHPKDMTRWQTNEAKISHHLLSFPFLSFPFLPKSIRIWKLSKFPPLMNDKTPALRLLTQ